MKKFILGFILGAMIFSVLPIKAAIEEYVLYKADYKLVIKGNDFVDPDHPILNYKGSTYGPLRAMLEAAGLKVDWNAEIGQATVTESTYSQTKSTTPTVTQSTQGGSEMLTTHQPSNRPGATPDGITEIDGFQGKYYIGFPYIDKKISEKGYNFIHNIQLEKWQIVKGSTVLIENVPTTNVYGADEVEFDYYVNTILPLIK